MKKIILVIVSATVQTLNKHTNDNNPRTTFSIGAWQIFKD